MRLIHTSDWHLGHSLRSEVTREYEHAEFLRWLLETCARERANALVITGDVFDSATPPASAEKMWFEFLAAARKLSMDIVAIAGNHDSPGRLGAASAVLRELGVHVIGGLPRRTDGSIDTERVLIPVAGGRGLIAAVPFLRPIDMPESKGGEDPLATIYGEVIAAARARRAAGQALIVTGHLYMAGADAQFLSERRVSIGGQESAPLRLFPDDITYVALGHIHRAQRVGRETIRYAGAPIALALDESAYKQQVLAIDFAESVTIRSLPIPRAVEIVRVPARGAAPLDEVLAELAMQPAIEDAADPTRPFLEVVVALDKPEPKLRSAIEHALEGKRPRLVYLHVEQTGDRAALGDRISARRLAELDPRDVFVRLWSRDHAQPPSGEVLAAFEELLAEVRGDRDVT